MFELEVIRLQFIIKAYLSPTFFTFLHVCGAISTGKSGLHLQMFDESQKMCGEGGRQTRSNELHGSPICPSMAAKYAKNGISEYQKQIHVHLLPGKRNKIHDHRVKEVMLGKKG